MRAIRFAILLVPVACLLLIDSGSAEGQERYAPPYRRANYQDDRGYYPPARGQYPRIPRHFEEPPPPPPEEYPERLIPQRPWADRRFWPQPYVWYHMEVKISGLDLHVANLQPFEGAPVVQGPRDPRQVWRLIPSRRHPDHFHIEFLTEEPNRYLDVYMRNRKDGGPVCVAKIDYDQVWKLIPIPHEGAGYFRIQSQVSGHYLDVFLGHTHPGARIGQARNPGNAQVWRFIPAAIR